jgi:hypothetical protein
MSKKHFAAIATDIHRQTEAASNLPKKDASRQLEALYELTLRLCQTFAGFNSSFDRERFVLACGFAALTPR